MAATKGGEDGGGASKLAAQKAAIEAERDASLSATNVELEAKRAAFVAESSAAGLTQQKKSELLLEYLGALKTAGSASAQINAAADAQIVTADREATNERLAIANALAQATGDDLLKEALKNASAAEKIAMDKAKNLEAIGKATAAQTLQAELAANDAEVNAETKAYDKRIAALDKFDKDYEKKVKELSDKIVAITEQGQLQEQSLVMASQQKMLLDITKSEDKMANVIASTAAKSIVEGKSMGAAFEQVGKQMLTSALTNLLQMETINERKKLSDAESAAADAWNQAGNPILGAISAAVTFAGVMGLAGGGLIPGSGIGDTVPAMLTPGETVVTKALTDRVASAERGGNSGGASHHTWNFAPQIHAMDAEGVDRVLAKHSAVFQRHVGATLRRMNH
jgi:hypothetical protein